MILLVLVRRAVCETCSGSFDLKPDEPLPDRCPLCASLTWKDGPLTRDAVYIRTGTATAKKKLNPGASSRKRQQQGRKQWRQFKPKPEESSGQSDTDQ